MSRKVIALLVGSSVLACSCTAKSLDTSTDKEDFKALWPVVDCSVFEPHDAAGSQSDTINKEDEEAAVREIGKALLTRGFFFAKHALDTDYIEEVYQASRRAHALPPGEKLKYAKRGYTGPDVGVEELSYEPTKKSVVMAWDYAKEDHGFVSASANRYPSFLEEASSLLYDRQAALGKVLLKAMARSLGLPPETFSQHTTGGELGSLRLLRYPAVNLTNMTDLELDQLAGISAHTDFEVFTLMHQDAPGLQVRARHSTIWEHVPIVPNTSLVIVGDVLERMTNGILRATPHRVPPTPHERYAIIRFNAFSADTVIAPLKEFVTEDRPAAYSKTTMEEIMRVVISNLEHGKGAWDPTTDTSTTATYDYTVCDNDGQGAS